MKDILIYKEFIGSVHFSADDKVFHGKIEGINDLVTFEGANVTEITKAFHEAVDDYIALCMEAGKKPLKSAKGTFNVRIDPHLHIRALEKAARESISLNQMIQNAVIAEFPNYENPLWGKLRGLKIFYENNSSHPVNERIIRMISNILTSTKFEVQKDQLLELRKIFAQDKGDSISATVVKEIDAYLKKPSGRMVLASGHS